MPFSYLQVEKAAKNPDDKKIAQATNLNYKLRFANVASGFNYLTDITATSLNFDPPCWKGREKSFETMSHNLGKFLSIWCERHNRITRF